MDGGVAVAPGHDDEALQQGFRVIQNAFHANVLKLEQELKGLKISHEELKTQGAQLQRRNSTLEVELVEGHQKCQQLSDDNKEVFKQVGQLRRQIQKLEGLKKHLMESMTDDFGGGAAAIDDGPHYGYDHGGYSGAGGMSGFGAPMSRDAGKAPWSAAAPAAAAAPPPVPGGAAAGGIDGKQFFRNARNNLSYEAFNDFLANIKRLNNQQQTREETLDEARRIFGADHAHLYRDFEQLLNRHTI
mmetsp:Transcript_15643/g.35962  ORF Transcript_15643/g.35962 Transcript_15643/m.35962 type:complete len:244 (-) Transcript_15643:18-749(-)